MRLQSTALAFYDLKHEAGQRRSTESRCDRNRRWAGRISRIDTPVKSRLSVTCLEPSVNFRRLVGESLDLSTPELFNDLDLPMQDLVQARLSIYKRHVVLKMQDESSSEYIPWRWLGRAPFNIELRTLHVDRTRLQQQLLHQANEQGVKIVRDKAVAIEGNGARLKSVVTGLGHRWPDCPEIHFHAPFSGLWGSWQMMRMSRWGKPAETLSNIPSFLPQLLIPTLIFHGSRDPAVPAAFARRASALILYSEMIAVDSGHFIPLNRPQFGASNLVHFFDKRSSRMAASERR